MFSVGDKIGNYTILKMLGEGGMGQVYLGEHRHIARRAAIKVIRHEGGGAFVQQLIERFFTEARAASLIQHPGIVEILDCDVVPNGPPFIVMEYLEGEGLDACLARVPGMGGDLNAVALVLAQVADALAAAHDKGIVHRDLKPANIFLVHRTHDPGLPFRAKVLDFGIAKLASSGGKSRLTQTGAVLGTPVYMSPEQCRGAGAVDQRADIYSMGAVAYEMLCGVPPFTHEAHGALIIAHASESPVPIGDRVPSLPADLAQLVDRMLAKRPEDRPQNMREVSAIARGAIQTNAPTGHTIALPPASSPTSPPVAFPSLVDNRTSQATYALPADPTVSPRAEREKETTFGQAAAAVRASRNERPRKASVVLGAVLGVAGLSGVAAWYVSSRPSERPAAPAAIDPPAAVVPAEEPVKEAAEQQAPDVQLLLTSVPEGAQVWVEGEEKERGRTPLELTIKPVAGEMRIRFERDGYLPAPLSVPSDRSGNYNARLEKRAQKPKTAGRPQRPVPSSPDPAGYEQLVE